MNGGVKKCLYATLSTKIARMATVEYLTETVRSDCSISGSCWTRSIESVSRRLTRLHQRVLISSHPKPSQKISSAIINDPIGLAIRLGIGFHHNQTYAYLSNQPA